MKSRERGDETGAIRFRCFLAEPRNQRVHDARFMNGLQHAHRTSAQGRRGLRIIQNRQRRVRGLELDERLHRGVRDDRVSVGEQRRHQLVLLGRGDAGQRDQRFLARPRVRGTQRARGRGDADALQLIGTIGQRAQRPRRDRGVGHEAVQKRM